MVRILRDGGEGVQVACVGQGVEVDDLEVARSDEVEDTVSSYKARTAGYEDGPFLRAQGAPLWAAVGLSLRGVIY